MDLDIAPDVLSTILSAVVYQPYGAVLTDIIGAFVDPQPAFRVRMWVEQLVTAGLLSRDETTRPYRYFLTPKAGKLVTRPGESDSHASGETSTVHSPESVPDSALISDVDHGRPADNSGPDSGQIQVPASVPASAPLPANSAPLTTPPGQPTAPAIATEDAQFASKFDEALFVIVRERLTRPTAIVLLQDTARFKLPDSELWGRFVEYGLHRLAHLTQAEAVRKGLLTEQYYAWLQAYKGEHFAAESPTAPAASPGTAATFAMVAEGAPNHAEPAPPPSPQSNASPAESHRREASLPAPVAHPEPAVMPPTGVPATEQVPSDVVSLTTSSGAIQFITGIAKAAVKRVMPKGLSPGAQGAFLTAITLLIMAAYRLLYGSIWLYVVAAILLGGGAWVFGRKPTAMPAGEGVAEGAAVPATAASEATAEAFTKGAVMPTSRRAFRVSRRVWWWSGAGVAVVALVVGGWWFWQVRQRPTAGDVSAYLVSSLAPLPVRVATIEMTYDSGGSAAYSLHYKARVELTQPLYQRTDTVAYLHQKVPSEMTKIDAAQSIRRGHDLTIDKLALPEWGWTPWRASYGWNMPGRVIT